MERKEEEKSAKTILDNIAKEKPYTGIHEQLRKTNGAVYKTVVPPVACRVLESRYIRDLFKKLQINLASLSHINSTFDSSTNGLLNYLNLLTYLLQNPNSTKQPPTPLLYANTALRAEAEHLINYWTTNASNHIPYLIEALNEAKQAIVDGKDIY